MNIVTFVSNEGERDVSPTLRGGGLMLPFWSAKFEDVVVDVEGKRDVKVVGADGRVGALCLGSFEVKETDLIPKEGANVALKRGETVGRRV
jgi:hypothetical protein